MKIYGLYKQTTYRISGQGQREESILIDSNVDINEMRNNFNNIFSSPEKIHKKRLFDVQFVINNEELKSNSSWIDNGLSSTTWFYEIKELPKLI